MSDHVYQLLLVEDSPSDATLFKEVLRSWAVRHLLQIVTNGSDAMAFLERNGDHSEALKPDLIFMDLSLPGLDGFETLRRIRSNPDAEVASIPVIVLTNSTAPNDVRRAYQNGANCYIRKPDNLQGAIDLMAAVEWFWFEVNKLPPPSAPPESSSVEPDLAGNGHDDT